MADYLIKRMSFLNSYIINIYHNRKITKKGENDEECYFGEYL